MVLVAIGVALTSLAVDPSIAGGAQGMLGYIFGFAFFMLALAVWAVADRAHDGPHPLRHARAGAVAGSVACRCCRSEPRVSTAAASSCTARWTPTPEELLLAQVNDEPKPLRAGATGRSSDGTRCTRRTRRTPLHPPHPLHRACTRRTRCTRCTRRFAAAVARFPWRQPRQRRPGRAHQHRLGRVPAGPDVAPADRAWMVVILRSRRRSLHAGAAWPG